MPPTAAAADRNLTTTNHVPPPKTDNDMSTHITHHTFLGRTAIAMLLAMMTIATAWADDQYEGNWYYKKTADNFALITGFKGTTATKITIAIPETLGGMSVIGFKDFTFEKDEFTSLETIEFPANTLITTIPADFARGCASLIKVDIVGNTSSNIYSLPASITTIGAGAFAGTNINQLTMPNVTDIGGSTATGGVGAFEGCNNLYRVTIGQAATIDDDAFANINRDQLCRITYNGPLANWSYKAYRRSPNVVVFCNDGSCGWAGDTGTENCVYWTRDANNNVLFACDDAEAYRQRPKAQAQLNISWMTMPDGTSEPTMTTLTMRNVYTTGVWNAPKPLQTVNLQEGVTAIDVGAFENIPTLTSVSMTADVTLIKSAAFKGCTSLKDLYFWGTKHQWENEVGKVTNWKENVSSDFQVHYRCTATFNMQSHGTAPEAQAVWNGEAVAQPTTPTAQGYQFGGWYTDAACTNAYNFDTPLADNITLYAQWTALTNTISFDTGGKGTEVSAQTLTSGETVAVPALQSYHDADGKDYGIEGWYTDADRLQRYDFSTPVDHSMTLYAKWAEAEATAIFNVTGGNHGTVTLTNAWGGTLNAGGKLIAGRYTLTVTPQSGYNFSGSYRLQKRVTQLEHISTFNGSSEQFFMVNLTDDDVMVDVSFITQPVVSVNVTTDGTATAGSYSFTDGLGNDYAAGGVLQHVIDPNDPMAPSAYYLTLTNKTPGNVNTGCAVTIVNNGVTSIRILTDFNSSYEFAPYGNIAIELFFYDKTAGVMALLDDDSTQPAGSKNADLISDANGKRRMVTLSGRTLYRDGGWNTLCLPFDVKIEGSALDKTGVTLMELDTETGGFDNGTLCLNFKVVSPSGGQGGLIEAGKPYVIKWAKPKTYDQNPSDYDITNPLFSGVTIKSAAPTAVTSHDGTVGFVGNYSPVSLSANADALYLGDSNTLYYPSQEMTLNGFRAFFQLGNSLTTSSRGDVNDDGETSISDVVYVVNYLLDNDDTHFVVANADVDRSDSIDIDDAAALVDLILDGTNKHILKNVVFNIDNTPRYGGAGSSGAK